ncbi:hypothetical protein [Marivirga arenosa]|uniref:YbbR-like domain-containing protein n=1 Tax=Marivirga arenosa TaxID=3059076 RepID=A0AA51ZWP0_9BACT|nr:MULTISPECIES: hypothetical protein [unclassified Marivirga]WMN07610.1 hypothetical protein QYS48_29330 [Marivirga sp. ABR2-2]WNB18183.1 hypothetical protein QYS47_29455 [Marivirga sp. BKB1-2]
MKQFENIWDWLSNLLLPQSNDTIKVVVLCFVTATTFWFFNALNDNYSTRISYPIKFTYQDSSLVVVEELPQRVSINVNGGGWNLLRKTFWFTIEPVEVPLEDPVNQKYILGSSLYSLIADQMTEVQLNFIETDTLNIEIDSLRSAKAKLFIDSTTISLAQDYRITSAINKSHDSAIFTGPERFIKNVPSELKIEIEEENISSEYDEDIYLPTFGSSLVNRNPVEINVQFRVSKFIQQELMLPFEKINAPEDSNAYIFNDSLARISFQIQEELAGNYNLDSIRLAVDYEQISQKDSVTKPIILSLPQILKDKKITIDSIKLQYEKP